MADYRDYLFLKAGEDAGSTVANLMGYKNKKEAESLLLEKQAIENELKRREMAQPSNLDAIFGTGSPGRKQTEGVMRQIFGVPQGPVNQEQMATLDSALSAVPTLKDKTGIPNELGGMQVKDPMDIANLKDKFGSQMEEVITEEEALKRGKIGKNTKVVSGKPNNNKLDEFLTPDEAMKLGVPYGTTRGQAKGKIPQKQATDAQSITAGFANRMEQSNAVFDVLEKYTDNLGVLAYPSQRALPDFLNLLKSNNFQSLEQAQRNFINAVLRRESGAVISPTEFADARRQYFPMPGDSKDVLEQKRMNRMQVQKNFIDTAGPAYKPAEFLVKKQYKNPLEVGEDISRGRITGEQGSKILREQFPDKFQ